MPRQSERNTAHDGTTPPHDVTTDATTSPDETGKGPERTKTVSGARGEEWTMGPRSDDAELKEQRESRRESRERAEAQAEGQHDGTIPLDEPWASAGRQTINPL